MSVSLDGKTECPCEAKVCQLDHCTSRINQKVLRLEVSMEDSARVTTGSDIASSEPAVKTFELFSILGTSSGQTRGIRKPSRVISHCREPP
jgi:hypothetical protein